MSIYATDNYNSGTGVSNFYISGSSTNTSTVVYKSGIFTRDIQASSGIVNIAHNLGVVPKKITFNSIYKFSNDTNTSQGVFDSNGNFSISYVFSPTNSYTPIISSTYAILIDTSSPSVYQRGLISVDATNIIIDWSAGTTSYLGDISVLYSAEG